MYRIASCISLKATFVFRSYVLPYNVFVVPLSVILQGLWGALEWKHEAISNNFLVVGSWVHFDIFSELDYNKTFFKLNMQVCSQGQQLRV